MTTIKTARRLLIILLTVILAVTFAPLLPDSAGDENEAYADQLPDNYIIVCIGGTEHLVDLAQSYASNEYDWNKGALTLTLKTAFSQLTKTAGDTWIEFHTKPWFPNLTVKLNDNIEINSTTTREAIFLSNGELKINLNDHTLRMSSSNAGYKGMIVCEQNDLLISGGGFLEMYQTAATCLYADNVTINSSVVSTITPLNDTAPTIEARNGGVISVENGGILSTPNPIKTDPDDTPAKKILNNGEIHTYAAVNSRESWTINNGLYYDTYYCKGYFCGAYAFRQGLLGYDEATFVIEAGAILTVPQGKSLWIYGTLYNSGTIINNGEIQIEKEQNPASNGLMNYDQTPGEGSGTIVNNGTITLRNANATLKNGDSAADHGVLQNNGTISNINGGKIFNRFGELTNASTGIITNSGTATFDNTDGTFYNSGSFTPGSTFSGSQPTDTNLAHLVSISAIPTHTYTGKAITPTVTLSTPAGLSTADYEVTYSNNVNAGTATAIVTGKGKYGGTKTATFAITPADLSALTPANIVDQIYSGYNSTPVLTITYNGKDLESGTDYSAKYTNNIYVGTASVTVTGMGNFTGTKTVTFHIVPALQNAGPIDLAIFSTDAKAPTVNRIAVADKVWTGKTLKSGFAITAGGKKLKSGTDYTITANGINKNIGKGSVTIKGKGNYKGIKILSFKITPKKGIIKKVTAGKRTLTVKWKKQSAAQKITGYKVAYKIKGAPKWKVKTVSSKKTGLVMKGLKKGKKYQVRIYAYKTIKSGVNKGTYNAPRSEVKTSAKIK
jgi:hypothetical protein